MTVFKAKPAIISFIITRTQLAIIKSIKVTTFGCIDLLAMLYSRNIIVVNSTDMIAI